MTNTCVCCGIDIPEGMMACDACMDRAVERIWRRDAKYEAVEEALQTLKARLNYDIKAFQKEGLDLGYPLGATAFKAHVDIVIDQLLNEYRRKRND